MTGQLRDDRGQCVQHVLAHRHVGGAQPLATPDLLALVVAAPPVESSKYALIVASVSASCSKRAPGESNGPPAARWSSSFPPAPTPRSNRPSGSKASVAPSRARRTGLGKPLA